MKPATGLANKPIKLLPVVTVASFVVLSTGLASAQETIDNTQTSVSYTHLTLPTILLV